MGCFSTSDRVVPTEIQPDNEKDENFNTTYRTTTDVCFLLFYTIFLTVLLFFLGYCVVHGDIFRTINGYDNCGRVCGRKNAVLSGEHLQDRCSATDDNVGRYQITLKTGNLLQYDRFCVDDCNKYPGYRLFLNRCIPSKNETSAVNKILTKTGLKTFFSEAAEDFHLCWPEFCYLCIISLAFSLLILVLFRYLIGFVVWLVLIGVVIASVVGTIFLWILWKKSKDDSSSGPVIIDIDERKTHTYLAFAITATLITLVVVLIIFVMRKRIKLVVQLFRESGKATAAMPVLLLEPIVTFVYLVFVISLWFYFCLWIQSSGFLTEKRPDVYYYQKDGWMKFTRWYNLLAMLWTAQFVIGCQHMVIAGAVSTWYFTRDKAKLQSPVTRSFYNLARYHLGSVALGSFVVACVQFARVVLKFVEKQLNKREGSCVECLLKCCHCCLYCFEKILKYLSRNAYIEVAMHGYTFCSGGKQAFKMLSSNALRVAAINSVGDFVLFLGKVLVVVSTILIGVKMLQHKEGLQHMWVPLTLAGLFAYFVAHCFMTVYEMAIDTIFLCFCEDCEENDGISKPYFMSRALMEFVENSSKAIDAIKTKKPDGPIRTVSQEVEEKYV